MPDPATSKPPARPGIFMRLRNLFASIKLFLLFSLNCLLLTLAWHSGSTAFLALTAFAPFFYILHHPPQTYNERLGSYFLAFFTVFLATYFTVYWIRSVGPAAHFITSLTRAATMFLPYLLTLWLRFNRKTKPLTASLVFIASWIVMELLHDLDIFGLPYGNMGHVLAAYPKLVQWYSITGATGGSLWILAVNLALAALASAILHPETAGRTIAAPPEPSVESKTPAANSILHRIDSILHRIHSILHRKPSILHRKPAENITSREAELPTNIKTFKSLPAFAILTLILIAVTCIPILTSLTMFTKRSGAANPTNVNVVALHTGSDVYDHKYNVDPDTLLREYLNETKKQLDPSRTNLIVWPENAITGNVSFNDPDTGRAVTTIRMELHKKPLFPHNSSQKLRNEPSTLLNKLPINHNEPSTLHNKPPTICNGTQNLLNETQNILIAGAVSEERVPPPAPGSYTPNILFNRKENYHFKLYNSAIFVQPGTPTTIKVKKKLVPLSEKVPASRLFAPLLRHIPVLADLNFSERSQQGHPRFTFNNDSCTTTPIICYGAAFSNFVAGETRNSGANFLAMIFNEGWMKSKKAYTHFHWFALCRTIENQRFLVKSSNEGITAITDHRGSELGRFGGTTNGAVQATLEVNNNLTFYTRHHRLITMVLLLGGLAYILAVLITRKEKLHRR